MKTLLRFLFRPKIVWPYCTVKYYFPPWPNPDVSFCGEVNWKYKPKKG